MAREWNLNLDQYDISKNRYRELKFYCLQYTEWKNQLRYETDSLKASRLDGLPHGTGIGNTTEALALKRAEAREKCELLEHTAQETDPGLYKYILKSVTQEDVGYTYLRTVLDIPCGRNQFYDLRRRFFCLLDRNKK